MPVHADNGEGRPLCGSGAVAKGHYRMIRGGITCKKCVTVQRDMSKSKRNAAPVVTAKPVVFDGSSPTLPKAEYVISEEVTVIDSVVVEDDFLTVTLAYNGARITVDNIKAASYEDAVLVAVDRLEVEVKKTTTWIRSAVQTN